MNYNDALNIIISKQSLGIKPGLSRILSLLDKMDNPQDKIKIIHIAGTNGKGTVAATIADALANHGYKVGFFSSPWVLDYREQITINGEYIPESVLSLYIEEYADNDCTEFELLTAVMYKYFADEAVDFAVIECGMGGRGDATNVEKSNVCSVLTAISLDHTAFLGNTIEEITREKEGIIRNSPCFRYKDTGDYINDNKALVRNVLEYLGITDDFVLTSLPARQERIGGILLDGGHNTSAARALSPLLNNEVAVIGMMRDKDVDGYLSVVAPKCKMIFTTAVDNPRSMPADELKSYAEKYCSNVVSVSSPLKAVEIAKEHGLTLACGSFYLAREIRKELF